MTPEEHAYYASHSGTSDPGDRAPLLGPLPSEPAALIAAVSGLVLHRAFVAPLGIVAPPGSDDDVECRTMSKILDRILSRDAAPLDVPRAPERRFIGICRDYALVACAVLRHHGVPARLRAGFARYFTPGYHDDHWVCEYHAGDRWRLLDPELSERVRAHFTIAFSPADVPRDQFLVAGDAWRGVRRGLIDPATCGVSWERILGEGFVATSVLRDLAALNKREMLAWDAWGIVRGQRPGDSIPEETAVQLDALAARTAGPDLDWAAIREVYECDGVRVPPAVLSFRRTGPAEVTVPL